jgi:hypothetical protein
MKLGTLSGCNEVNNFACLCGCYGNTLVPMIHSQRNKQQFRQLSLITIVHVGVVISLNRYNKQTSPARSWSTGGNL